MVRTGSARPAMHNSFLQSPAAVNSDGGDDK